MDVLAKVFSTIVIVLVLMPVHFAVELCALIERHAKSTRLNLRRIWRGESW